MAIRIVRLGSPRDAGEGVRIGSVRRPPRGVPKAEFAKRDYYDVWMPLLAPSAALVKQAQSANSAADWNAFMKKYRAEMNESEASRLLDLLAALSADANFALGCYCEDESHCHRSLLRKLLQGRGATVV